MYKRQHLGEDMSLDELTAGVRYHYENSMNDIDGFSLWLCWGNLTVEQQADLKDFQAKGSRAVLCWRAGDIGGISLCSRVCAL